MALLGRNSWAVVIDRDSEPLTNDLCSNFDLGRGVAFDCAHGISQDVGEGEDRAVSMAQKQRQLRLGSEVGYGSSRQLLDCIRNS